MAEEEKVKIPRYAMPDIMGLASDELLLSLKRIRAAVDHNLSIGESAEESVRRFLRSHLPESIGVAKGQVIDSRGGTSKQLDVILYDMAHTPVLFRSDEENYRLIPVEGVMAVIEVKATVSGADLASIAANMESVKALEKRAYFDPVEGVSIVTTTNLFGQSFDHFPITFSLFAFEASSSDNMVPAFRTANNGRSLSRRIDNACLLNRGVIMNFAEGQSYSGTPYPASTALISETEHRLLLWYLLNSNVWLQARMKPINMVHYLGDDFAFG